MPMDVLGIGILITGWLIAGQAGLAAGPASDTDWPQWRGPQADGHSAEIHLLETWPETGPPVLWSREIGQGYSSLIVVGNRVFTQEQTLYEQAVICLDADTGQTVWSTRYGWPYEGGGLYPGPRSTPAYDRGRIYFAAPDGTVGCLNARDGAVVWTVNPTKQFRGRGTDFGYSCSPVIADNKVIVPVGGHGASVVALSITDGSVVWQAGDAPASYATPVIIEHRGRKLVIALLENSLAAIELGSGRLLWELDLSEGYDEHSAAPVYREPLLMFAGPFRSGARCLKLNDDPAVPPARVWESLKFSNDVASSVLYDGRVYGFDLRDQQSRVNRPSRGEYRCLDFETGRILWSTDQVGHANTILADGKLILFNDRGEVILARAGTADYEELARASVFEGEICWSAPALSRGRLYLRTQSRLACLGIGAKPPERAAQTLASIPRHRRAFDPTGLLGGEREFPATTPEWSEFRTWYLWSLAALGLATVVSAVVQWGTARGSGRRAAVVPSASLNPVNTRAPGPEEVPATGSPEKHQIPTSDRSLAPSWNGIARTTFWLAVLLAGAIGSPVLNAWQDEYVFLWPLALWCTLQITVETSVWAERQPNRRRARWRSRGVGLMFLGACALYFHLCRSLGMSIEWCFLIGLLPGFAAAALVASQSTRWTACPHLARPLALSASFSIYFWSAAVFMKTWLPVGS